MVACQRPGLAEKSQYRYARGGTDITGPTIDLLEVIVQKWGNVEYGFRELARFAGENGKPGESIVEAFSWDLESNTRRRTQFSIPHAIGLKGNRTKTLTDPRDIYEWVANNAQRRVRSCLEQIIPRDVIDMAREECDKTLTAHVDVTPDALKKLVDAFVKHGVTKSMIEARIQRRLETVTPAQVLDLRKIWTSLRDGVGQVDDWFEVEVKEPAKSAAELAKEKMRKTQSAETSAPDKADAPKPEETKVAAGEPVNTDLTTTAATGASEPGKTADTEFDAVEWCAMFIAQAPTLKARRKAEAKDELLKMAASGKITDEQYQKCKAECVKHGWLFD
jgi:hypothetical protein